MLEFITTSLVTEPAIVADGDDFTLLLPEHYGEEFAGRLSRLVANIETYVSPREERATA